jgi:DnaK suppressor protein
MSLSPEKMMQFKTFFEAQKSEISYSQAKAKYAYAIDKDETFDETDLTSAELEQQMGMRLKNRESLYLRKITAALAKIHDGTFGECDECGCDIEEKRLEARPTATQCVGCKEESERRELLHADGRKHKSLGAGFSKNWAI